MIVEPTEEEPDSSVAELWLQAGATATRPSPPPPPLLPPAAARMHEQPPRRSGLQVRPSTGPSSPFSPFPLPSTSPRNGVMLSTRRWPAPAVPAEDPLALSIVAGEAIEPASPNASTDDSSMLQRSLQPSSRSSIIYLDRDPATAAPARSSASQSAAHHCGCWRFVTWSWHRWHSRIWTPLTSLPAWTRRWRRGQQLVRELANHSGSGPPTSTNGSCMRRCAAKTMPLLRRHWIICVLVILAALLLWLSFVFVLLSSHEATTAGAEPEGGFLSPLGRVRSKFMRQQPGDTEGEATRLLDPSRLASLRQWNLHNSDSNKLASGVKVPAVAGAGSAKATVDHRHLHLHELSEQLQAQADSHGSEPHRSSPPAAPAAAAAPLAPSGDLSDALIDAMQKSWEGLTPDMQAEHKQRASKQSKQAKQAQLEAQRMEGRIRKRLESEPFVKPDPILPLLDRDVFPSSSAARSTAAGAWDECTCLQHNLPKFALLQSKLLAPTLSADPQRLPLIETLLDSIEVCVPMEPACAQRWSEEHYLAMDDLMWERPVDGASPSASQQPQPLSDRSQPPPPHPPIAILLSPSHLGLTLSSDASELDDGPSLRLSPRWTELKLLLLRLWSMPGADPSRVFLFMPRLVRGDDGATSLVDVPAWFRTDWRTLRSQASGDPSADLSVAGAAHARIVSAFLQLQIVDIEAAAGTDGQAWAHELAEWGSRRTKALAEFDQKQQRMDAVAAAAEAADDAHPPPPLNSLSPSVVRADLDSAFSRDLHRMRSNLDHWSLLTYLFAPQDLPDALAVELMARQVKGQGGANQQQQLPTFDSLVLMDPQSFPSLDLIHYFTRTQALINPPTAATSSAHTDHSIVLVSAGNVAPSIDVAASGPQLQRLASISASGMERSTGWLSPSIAGGAWLLSRSLFESVRTCQTCWPASDLSLGGGGGAHAKSTAPRTSKRMQRSKQRHTARMRLIREAQEREGNSADPPSLDALSSLVSRPSAALLSSGAAEFNEDACGLSRWDEPFAKFIEEHNVAQRALEEAARGRGGGASSNNKGAWRGLKSMESLQPLISRVRRINLRSAAVDLKQRVQERVDRANFLPDRWSPSRSDLSSLLSRSYQQRLYSRLYSAHEHDILASSVDPGWSVLSARFFSAAEVAAEDDRVREENWTRLQAVDEEVLPCLLALWLSPAARAGRDVLVLLDDVSAVADEEPSEHMSLWSLLSEGLLGSSSAPAVHHGLLTWRRPSSSAWDNVPSVFFLATSSLYHTHYAIARSPGRRGINRATLLASLRALGSVSADQLNPTAAALSSEPRQSEDGARILMSASFSHALPSPTPTSEPRCESSPLFPDTPPIDRTWHHDHNCLSLLREMPEHAGAAAGSNAAWPVHSRLVYRPSLNSLSDASTDSKLHLRSRWNVRIPLLRHGRACEANFNTTEEQEDHGWMRQQQDTAEIDRSEFAPEEDQRPALIRAAPPSSSFSPPPLQQHGPVSPHHFAPGVCMVVGHAGESCDEVCEGMVAAAPDSPDAPADGAPPAPSRAHAGLFRCAPSGFELLSTFPLVLSRYFRDFGFCAAHHDASMHATWDAAAGDQEPREWQPSISLSGANNKRARCDLLAPALQRVSTCEAKPPAAALVRRVCPCQVAPTQQTPNTKQT